jgi:hypothetical protein
MSKVLFGAIVTDMRNKLGGHVFSKNKGGSFMRRKVSPLQPRTDAQRAIRSGMTSLSKAWSGVLDDPGRAAWNSFAKNNPTKDIFGSTVVLTGEQTYVRVNQGLLYAGLSRIDVPPVNLTVPGISAFLATANHTTPDIRLSAIVPAQSSATILYMIWATRQLSIGINSLASYYRFLTSIISSTLAPKAIAASPTGAVIDTMVATITTTTDHHLLPGDEVTIDGVTPTEFNGTWTVATAPTSLTFTFPISHADDTGGGGTATTTASVIAAYSAKFGPLETGKVMGIGLRILDSTTGAQSPLFTARIAVT